jgi:hypothetical protein
VISGNGLKTAKKSLKAGTRQIRVPLTKKGRRLRSHHKKATVGASLTAGAQHVAAKASAVQPLRPRLCVAVPSLTAAFGSTAGQAPDG